MIIVMYYLAIADVAVCSSSIIEELHSVAISYVPMVAIYGLQANPLGD